MYIRLDEKIKDGEVCDFLCILKKIKKSRVNRNYATPENYTDENGDFRTFTTVYNKCGLPFLIMHTQYVDNGAPTQRGQYALFEGEKYNQIGSLKYVFHSESEECYMTLSDIHIEQKFRNCGIGRQLLKDFESRAISYNCSFIDGKLVDRDAESEKDAALRDNFYIRNGYTIDNDNIRKYLKSENRGACNG